MQKVCARLLFLFFSHVNLFNTFENYLLKNFEFYQNLPSPQVLDVRNYDVHKSMYYYYNLAVIFSLPPSNKNIAYENVQLENVACLCITFASTSIYKDREKTRAQSFHSAY